MSISSELSRLATAKADLKTAINAKGGSLDDETLDDYAAAVAALSGGGIDAGIVYDTIDGSGNPTSVTVYGTLLPKNGLYGMSTITSVVLSVGILGVGSTALSVCTNLEDVDMANTITSIDKSAFSSCAKLTKMWIPLSCTAITASAWSSGPFAFCSSTLALYCEAASKPAGWGTYWNYYGNGLQLTVNWSITEAAFDAL